MLSKKLVLLKKQAQTKKNQCGNPSKMSKFQRQPEKMISSLTDSFKTLVKIDRILVTDDLASPTDQINSTNYISTQPQVIKQQVENYYFKAFKKGKLTSIVSMKNGKINMSHDTILIQTGLITCQNVLI